MPTEANTFVWLQFTIRNWKDCLQIGDKNHKAFKHFTMLSCEPSKLFIEIFFYANQLDWCLWNFHFTTEKKRTKRDELKICGNHRRKRSENFNNELRLVPTFVRSFIDGCSNCKAKTLQNQLRSCCLQANQLSYYWTGCRSWTSSNKDFQTVTWESLPSYCHTNVLAFGCVETPPGDDGKMTTKAKHRQKCRSYYPMSC